MITTVLAAVATFVQATIGAYSYLGVGVLMALESANIPIPSELILPFAGYLVGAGAMDFHLAALAATVGGMIGSLISYGIGYYGGRPFVERYGQWVFLRIGDLDRAQHWIHRYGRSSFVITRLLPVVRTFISLPAGVLRVDFWSFTILSTIGSYVWSYLLIYVGWKFYVWLPRLQALLHIIDITIVICIVAGVLWWLKQHRRYRNT